MRGFTSRPRQIARAVPGDGGFPRPKSLPPDVPQGQRRDPDLWARIGGRPGRVTAVGDRDVDVHPLHVMPGKVAEEDVVPWLQIEGGKVRRCAG